MRSRDKSEVVVQTTKGLVRRANRTASGIWRGIMIALIVGALLQTCFG